MTERILITGAFGQIGYELLPELQKKYGKQNVIALGHHKIPKNFEGVLEKGSVENREALKQIIQNHKITQIYHMAAILSVGGQQDPELCWNVNMNGSKNVLDLAVEFKLRVFLPSSIAVFGPSTPKHNTPQHTVHEPITMYGVTKYSGQLLSQYYFLKYGLDVRSLRYPGIISWKVAPGGGTTDYAVAIFYDAIEKGKYESFVKEETKLPMMYMDDAIRATIELMEAKPERIKVRTSYNLAAISFTVKQLAQQVARQIPGFEISYNPDQRQKTADSWPSSIDDSAAREDWGWKPEIDLQVLCKIMIENLKHKLK